MPSAKNNPDPGVPHGGKSPIITTISAASLEPQKHEIRVRSQRRILNPVTLSWDTNVSTCILTTGPDASYSYF